MQFGDGDVRRDPIVLSQISNCRKARLEADIRTLRLGSSAPPIFSATDYSDFINSLHAEKVIDADQQGAFTRLPDVACLADEQNLC